MFVPGPRAVRFVSCFVRYCAPGPAGPECSLRISTSRVFLWPREWWSRLSLSPVCSPLQFPVPDPSIAVSIFRFGSAPCCAQGPLPPIFPIAIFSAAQYSARQVSPVSFVRCSFFRSICSARSIFHLQPRPARCFLLKN
jgi:hypothetical protein